MLYALYKNKVKCNICPPLIPGSGALRNVSPTHLPPSPHLKCQECFTKPTGIGKIAEQKQHCDTMVMVATENPSLGRSKCEGEPASVMGWGAMPTASSPSCWLLNLDFSSSCSPPCPGLGECAALRCVLTNGFCFLMNTSSKRAKCIVKKSQGAIINIEVLLPSVGLG